MPIITAPAELPKSAPVSEIVDRVANAKAIAAGQRQPDTVEGAAPAVEAPKPESEATEEQLSPKFAALARKERALRSKYQEVKTREEALKAKEAELGSAATLKTRLASDPISVLNELGISYEQLTNLMLNQPNMAEQQAYAKLQAEIEAVKQAQTQSQTKQEELVKQQYDQAVNQIRSDVKVLVAADPLFETIKEMGQEEAVVELIKETFNAQGIVLDLAEAAQQVEDYLVEEALKYAQLKKVQAKLTPPAPAASGLQKQQPSQKQPLKTLTNQATASSSKPLTAKERRERAILAFKGQLNK